MYDRSKLILLQSKIKVFDNAKLNFLLEQYLEDLAYLNSQIKYAHITGNPNESLYEQKKIIESLIRVTKSELERRSQKEAKFEITEAVSKVFNENIIEENECKERKRKKKEKDKEIVTESSLFNKFLLSFPTIRILTVMGI